VDVLAQSPIIAPLGRVIVVLIPQRSSPTGPHTTFFSFVASSAIQVVAQQVDAGSIIEGCAGC
jgi:hypothetical protein